jgi:sortase A
VNAVRALVRGVGELLITAGLVVLLFCVYQLFWTNVEAGRAQDRVAQDLTDDWRRPQPPGPSAPSLSPVDFGKGFAFLRIPRLGEDFAVPVVQGVRESDLARGIGHYPKTVGPGAVGNFAVAGHRATHGEPFRNLDRMRTGDRVVVETKDTWFTYVVDRTRIVSPADVWVIEPVPGRPGAKPTRELMTLTTCHPRWASTHRLIVFTHLDSEQAKTDGPPPALLAGRR